MSITPSSGGTGTPSILRAAQITAVYSSLYSLTFVNQLLTKKRLYRKAKINGDKPFDRYTSVEMRPADRLTANFLEWYPAFIGPLWALALTDRFDETCGNVAWTYVGMRGLYVGLVLIFGVDPTGWQIHLWASTLPGYVTLIYLQVQALKLLII